MKDKPTVICVVNQKGGTAKTTTVENLGIGLAREGKKVLLVDTDPQGSLTISLGYPRPDDLETTLFDLLIVSVRKGISFPLLSSARSTAFSSPPQQGTSIRTRRMSRMSFPLRI